MERITFDGLFCDIAMCQENECPHKATLCSQRQVWDRLKALEDILGQHYEPDQLQRVMDAYKANRFQILPVAIGETVYEIYRMSNRDALAAGVPKKETRGRNRNKAAWQPWAVREKKMTKTMYLKWEKSVFLDKYTAEETAENWNYYENEQRRK